MTDQDKYAELRRALQAGPTPGEWAWGPTFDNDGEPESIVNALDGAAVVAVTLDFGANNPTWREANAQLIAAANPVTIAALIADRDALALEVERLIADRDSWADQAENRVVDVLEAYKERDALAQRVAELERAMTVPTIEKGSQQWAELDGAVAFHLIERHSDNWADAGLMMEEFAQSRVDKREPNRPRDSSRYAKLRCLNPRQFADIFNRNLAGEHFDDLVDAIGSAKEGV